MATPAWGTQGSAAADKEITDAGLREWGWFHPWKGAVRIPLPEDSTGDCTLDRGRAVSVVWFEGGTIRQFCADHDPAWLPRPVHEPSWWRYPWPYGPPPSYGQRVAAWLRSFPRPPRLHGPDLFFAVVMGALMLVAVGFAVWDLATARPALAGLWLCVLAVNAAIGWVALWIEGRR
jgi:hypothetical protein